jgi:hypothetical protein
MLAMSSACPMRGRARDHRLLKFAAYKPTLCFGLDFAQRNSVHPDFRGPMRPARLLWHLSHPSSRMDRGLRTSFGAPLPGS